MFDITHPLPCFEITVRLARDSILGADQRAQSLPACSALMLSSSDSAQPLPGLSGIVCLHVNGHRTTLVICTHRHAHTTHTHTHTHIQNTPTHTHTHTDPPSHSHQKTHMHTQAHTQNSPQHKPKHQTTDPTHTHTQHTHTTHTHTHTHTYIRSLLSELRACVDQYEPGDSTMRTILMYHDHNLGTRTEPPPQELH